MSTPYEHPQITLIGDALLGIYDGLTAAARAAARQARRRRGLYQTLPPGAQTPLWNELVQQARPFLAKRGSKVRLARFLGIPRQRLYVCLKAGRGCLDAERTLRLLCWLTARQQGRELDL